MIDVLISGKLRGTPTVRTSSNGKPYALFRISAADKTGESRLCSCITFSDSALQAVQRLADGDSIAVTGEATIKTWIGPDGANRNGLDVAVHGVLTAYHTGRKRKAAEPQPADTAGGL